MFSFGKSKRIVNLVIDDYIVRMVENNGEDISSITHTAEKLLPPHTIENGKIVDELAFFEFMKEAVSEWRLKKRQLHFYVPNELVIMREIELTEKVAEKELKQYITMEIGHTIHFPFKNPVFDVYDTAKLESKNKVIVLAAPEEEIIKYVEVFEDVGLTAIAVDVQPLGVYRYFLTRHEQTNVENVYLYLELNLTSVNFSVFRQHKLEFLRFQSLNLSIDHWQPVESDTNVYWTFTGDETHLFGEMEDQLNEIDRLMNFYRFSIHQGKHAISHIILLGDYPYLDDIKRRILERYNVVTNILATDHIEEEQINRAFIPTLGLALRGDK